jgi:predicted TIM-barrel fold metal-dependent hydrolase
LAERIIDTHPHIASPDTTKYPIDPIGGIRSDWSKERSVTFAELEKAMDEAGVTKAAIVHSSTTYGFDNSYVADSIAGRHDRFAGVFSVNATLPDSPQKIRYWRDRGLDGLRIYTRGTTMKDAWLDVSDSVTEPFWKAAGDIGVSVCLNVLATTEGMRQLRAILARYPSTPIFIDHLGRPPIEDGPPYNLAREFFDLAKHRNFYLKLTPSGLSAVKGKATVETYISKLIEVFGADHIAWGSNFPSSPGSLGEIVATAKAQLAHVSASDREWIFAKTAQVLYPNLK